MVLFVAADFAQGSEPVAGIAFEGTRRAKKEISIKYAALLTGARQGSTTRSALHKPLAGNILQQAPETTAKKAFVILQLSLIHI